MARIFYQTLKDKNNPLEVMTDGPYECRAENAWLGQGYYFWDSFKEYAHWWGEAKVKPPYMICQAKCNEYNEKQCLDLVGNTEDMALFDSIVNAMKHEGLFDDKTTTVSEVIFYLKKIGLFDWKAMRVIGANSISPKRFPNYTFRMNFEVDQKFWIDYKPPIQICLYEKNAFGLHSYSVIYPEKYTENRSA